ncbi:acyl-CoA dehydrogenase family protein [Aquisalimonas lutea]|uniref:acyl-CoA dehydrogenase family protein n=1 Tax=Aquisalimonas lutea TaxID=1327750 RepID=UPI0025B5BECE|nr:acyl-CoA dehydrogenase family protein [Aquisalimonas lutea]MDN3517552.1 acyl-CoA dehydrogenase family protein [Aquisalimonas lutea]
MDFQLNPDQRALQDAARRFAQNELPELARELERTNEPVPKAWLRRYAEQGFLGVNLPVELGGLGLSNLDAMIVLEEFAKISVAVAFPVFESVSGPIHGIAELGEPALAKPLCNAVCQGESVVAVSMSEPNAGTALTDLTTRGRIEGDEIVLNGQKRWCSGGGHADGYFVYCRLSEDRGAKGIGAVYVEGDRDGLSFGPPEELMGFRGVPSADIFLDDVRVPRDHLIVPAGGFRQLMEVFDLERCGNATMSVGLGAAALDQALAYVQERQQFGKPIADFQAVQLRLAEMAMQVEAARLLVWRALAGSGGGHQLPSLADTSLAKCFANEMVRDVCGQTVQIMGGYGYHKEYEAERRFRDSWGWGIAGGTIDIQKVNIASSLIGRRFNQRS